ncbi:MAG: DNA primase [Chloroflexi bacterium]|nr:DNA primase [Chloroflexota bacterium]
MSVIDEIKARIDIVDLVSESVKLRRAGRNYTGFCPFHTNTRTPAFVVFPDSGTWRCFGECNEGGDIFKFVMKKEGWDFREALQNLALRAGVELEPQTPERQEHDDHLDRLRNLLEEAVIFYRHQLLQSEAGAPARAYLQKRGLQAETIEVFGLGYAPEGWDAALNHFKNRGYSVEEMMQAGLLSEGRGDSVYDRFRNRILFAIRDARGGMAGFGARALNPDDMPKYLNSPQSDLFDKGRLLYGLDRARKSIRALDQVVIVEGYMDVIVPHQAGFTNLVSPMGTALTEDQLRQLKRYTRRIVLALDPDAAGEKATLRGLEIARQTLDRSDELSFDARGLLRHEARLQADLRVTTLPEGLDPDEVVLRDPQEWQRIVEAAKPILIHVMETLAAQRDVDDPKTKAEIAAQIQPLIEDVPNPVEREAYRQRLARLLKIDERALVGARVAAASGAVRRRAARPAAPPPDAAPALEGSALRSRGLERHIVGLLLRMPEVLFKLDLNLQDSGLARLSSQDFDDTELQGLVELVQQSVVQAEHDPQPYIERRLPEELHERYEALRAPLEKGEPQPDKLLEDLFHSILDLRKIRISDQINQLQFLEPEFRGETFQQQVGQIALTKARLDAAFARPLQVD